MQIPEHWAEARVEGAVAGKKRVVRRFGWSDTSAEDAQQNAEQRALAALRELQAGRSVPSRERRVAYGARGLPIREQVLARRDAVVITRNSYGAHCLNVPDVLFADVDVDTRLAPGLVRLIGIACLAAGLAGLVAAIVLFSQRRGVLGGIALALGFVVPLVLLAAEGSLRRRPGHVARCRERVRSRAREVALAVPGGRFSFYETPAGWRLLALYRTFEPTSRDAVDLLRALGSDPAYVQMCELQACFRARTSGKPWRMGIADHIRPRPGLWPVHPDRRALRDEWVARYEAVAANFAACRWLEDLGDAPVDPRCAEVQRIHDELSRARSDLPLA